MKDDSKYIDIEPDGFIFCVSDLSYKKQLLNGNPGSHDTEWSQESSRPYWYDQAGVPFKGPGGYTHVTVYLRFDQ